MKILTAFIIGTIASLGSMAYIFRADVNKNQLPHKNLLPFGIALIYGIANIIITKTKIPTAIVGAMVGLLMSILGRFYLGNLPHKLFGFEKGKEYQVHPTAMVAYAVYFHFVVIWLNKWFEPLVQ